MTRIKIEPQDGGTWYLTIGSRAMFLTSLEVWALQKVLQATENDVYEDIRRQIDPDGSN